MVLTIRKTKLGVEDTAATQAETAGVETASEQEAPRGPVLSAVAPPVSSGEKYTVYAILGIVAVLVFAALIILQVMEISYYNQPPPAFLAGQ